MAKKKTAKRRKAPSATPQCDDITIRAVRIEIPGGATVIISTHSTGGGGLKDDMFVRYIIPKPLQGDRGKRRARKQAAYLEELGIRRGGTAGQLRVDFALVHGGA